MSAKEQIQRLESLLARVQARASAPRAGGVQVQAQAAAAPSAPPPAARTRTSAPPTYVDGDEAYEDVEVSAEIDIDVEEEGDEGGGGHTEAFVASPAAAPQLHVMRPAASEELEATPEPRPANEIEEPAPSSSPRAIDQGAAESAPRHTPPPESGKLPAASSAPPARASSFPPPRAPSVPSSAISDPPPSVEGHTLIGGWREPGLGGAPVPPGSAFGVRVPSPGAGGPPVPEQGMPGSMPPPQAFVGASPGATGDFAGPKPARRPQGSTPVPAGPEVTKPELAAGARVASFTGTMPAFAPATFGELLDATLGL